MTSNIRPIISDAESICELLEAAIDLIKEKETNGTVDKNAQLLSHLRALKTRKINPTDTEEVCRSALMMAYIEDALTTERWEEDIVSQAMKVVRLHSAIDQPGNSPQDQALVRLTTTLDDCREMIKLKSPPIDFA